MSKIVVGKLGKEYLDRFMVMDKRFDDMREMFSDAKESGEAKHKIAAVQAFVRLEVEKNALWEEIIQVHGLSKEAEYTFNPDDGSISVDLDSEE